MDHHVVVLGVTAVGQDTYRILVERPMGYEVRAGQAADIALDEAGWWDKPRPFHFRRVDDDDTLEFVVRANELDTVIGRLCKVRKGDSLVISAPLEDEIPDVFFGGWRRPQMRAGYVKPAATIRERDVN